MHFFKPGNQQIKTRVVTISGQEVYMQKDEGKGY